METPPLYLPHELIIEILLRLPVKSLIRFKCVSKSWFSLISHPHFANSHYQIASRSGTHARRILLMSTSRVRECRSIDFEASSSLHDDSASVSLYPNFMHSKSYYLIVIKGSCRGFLLFHCYSDKRMYWIYDIYLWNPSTGFHKNIPSSPFSSKLDDNYFYGFGYDHSTDDYLLVKMFGKDKYNQLSPLRLEFFSLRANKWKEIEGTQFSYRNIKHHEVPESGFLFNGAIHWFAYCRELLQYVIIAFDLMEKKLFNMHLPDDFDNHNFDWGLDRFGLWVFGESLSIWAEYYLDDDIRLEVWVMKEYKTDSPWTKIFFHRFDAISPKFFYPKCSTKSGDIIGTCGFTLVKCDNNGQLLEYDSHLNGHYGCDVALYIESLLSLPDNEQAQEDDSNKKNEVVKYSSPFS